MVDILVLVRMGILVLVGMGILVLVGMGILVEELLLPVFLAVMSFLLMVQE